MTSSINLTDRQLQKLMPIAAELGVSMAQLAIAWCLKNPNVSTVITGASKVSQVTENMKAVDLVDKLDSQVMEKIETILQGYQEPLNQD